MKDTYKLYDTILASLYQNIEVEAGRDEGIYIAGYQDDPVCNTYMKMVETKAALDNMPITMVMPLLSYIEFIIPRWKMRKQYRWARNFQSVAPLVTPIRTIAKFVAEYHNETINIYYNIYKEYYA